MLGAGQNIKRMGSQAITHLCTHWTNNQGRNMNMKVSWKFWPEAEDGWKGSPKLWHTLLGARRRKTYLRLPLTYVEFWSRCFHSF
mmetsp:Transcript_19282/g.34145  ORF Transcript_19282/g.34145 Transcript_19282/m.34145 type:complete len:85 (+) Transcript_19282:1089-1343(+)